jgi:hypothetical protein
MQPNETTSVRARLIPRFDAATGHRRRWSFRAVAAAIAIAMISGGGIAVASVSAAQAHNADYTTTCSGVTVHAWSYEPSGNQPGETNTITFQVDSAPVETFSFEVNATKTFLFPNSTEEHTYSITVNAWNDPTNTSWNKKWLNLKSTPCVPPGIISLSATKCNVVNGSSNLTATFDKLVAGRAYSLTLASTIPSSSTVIFTPTQVSQQYNWSNLTPGKSYTVTITDTTNHELSATATVAIVGCPEQSGIQVSTTQCTAPGQTGILTVTGLQLVAGREYRIDLLNSADVVVDSVTFTADGSGQFTKAFAATPLGTFYATVTDTAASQLVSTSNVSTLLPCPKTPAAPTLALTQCTSTNETNGAIGITLGDLVPGRQYTLSVTDSSNATVFTETFLAAASTLTKSLSALPSGTYTATVTDVLVPAFHSSSQAVLIPCPMQPEIDVSVTECGVPGGTSQIKATVTHFIAGRTYTISLTRAGQPVIGPNNLVAPAGPSWALPTFALLDPGEVYRVIVTDTLVPSVKAAADIAVSACPGDPRIVVTKGTCSILGISTLHVEVANLLAGETYTLSIVVTATGKPVPGVPSQSVPGGVSTASLDLQNVPNGAVYTITIENQQKTLSASAQVLLEECDLPTLPLPPDLPTLALTGADGSATWLSGIAFIQLGLVLLGLGFVRRRGNSIPA